MGDCQTGAMPKYCTIEEAVALLHPTDTIGMGLALGNPSRLLVGLNSRSDWKHLVLGATLLVSSADVLLQPGVELRSGFFGPIERLYASMGASISFIPAGFRQFAVTMRRLAPRVMAVQGRIDEAAGLVNLSLHVGGTRSELLLAGADPNRVLIVEDNPLLPLTSSLSPFENTIPLELVDLVVPGGDAPYVLAEEPSSEVDAAVAGVAATFVVDEATLQCGIGAIPNLVAKELSTRSGGGYGIHSEMFTNGLLALHKAGKVTNTNKGVYDGASVTTFALGSAELYAFLDQNPDVAFLPVDAINDPTIIRDNRNFTSINGAIAVDAVGQIVAEAVDGRQISGVGGHEDFVAGAGMQIDDVSMVVLHSTVEVGGERRSRIVPAHPAGAIVSTPRHHTGVIVTEFGAADLRGLSLAERARALAEIAHPDFRGALKSAATQFGRSRVSFS